MHITPFHTSQANIHTNINPIEHVLLGMITEEEANHTKEAADFKIIKTGKSTIKMNNDRINPPHNIPYPKSYNSILNYWNTFNTSTLHCFPTSNTG